MGLRLRDGIEPARFRTIPGRMIDHDRIQDLMGDGMIAHLAGSRSRRPASSSSTQS